MLFIASFCNAQIEVAHFSTKEFKSIGFGAFLNFSFPVSEADYITAEGGVQYFKDNSVEAVAMIPVLIGYRYTLNRSGTGFYVEPNAGFSFCVADYSDYSGATAGIGVGYLIDLGNVPFNFGLRYEHSFGNPSTNIFALRIAHSLSFGRRNKD